MEGRRCVVFFYFPIVSSLLFPFRPRTFGKGHIMEIVSLAFSVLCLFNSISDFSTMGVKRLFFILFQIQNLGNLPKFSLLVRKAGTLSSYDSHLMISYL